MIPTHQEPDVDRIFPSLPYLDLLNFRLCTSGVPFWWLSYRAVSFFGFRDIFVKYAQSQAAKQPSSSMESEVSATLPKAQPLILEI